MRGLADKRENRCEHVYTTQHCCVAAQTRLRRRALKFAGTYGQIGWSENCCCILLSPGGRCIHACSRNKVPLSA